MAIRLGRQHAIDSWSGLIENGADQAASFMSTIEKHLRECRLPNVTISRVEVVPAKVMGWFGGDKREYLLMSHKNLTAFKMYINVREYGNFLNVIWILNADPGFFKRRFSKHVTGYDKGIIFMGMDAFQQQEFDAFVSVGYRAVKDTVKTLHEQLNQDFNLESMRSRTGLAAW